MKKRLLCIMVLLALTGGVLCVGLSSKTTDDAPMLRVFDENGDELPVLELSDDEVEQMLNVPSVALSSEDFDYFIASGQSFMSYATMSVPDFRNELAKQAKGAKRSEETEEYELFDEPYFEGPPINMEHFADMVDYYKDRNESVALLVYYQWDPFTAYENKFKAYASSFERADVLVYWGEEAHETGKISDTNAETSLGEALEMVPGGKYDHLLIVSTDDALANAEELSQQITARSDFEEVVIFTYKAASLRHYPESAMVLDEKFGVVPILRPLMAWDDVSSE